MDRKKKCTACNIKLDKNNYLKDRLVCKRCYNNIRRKDNKNTLFENQQPKTDIVNNNNNRSLIIGFPSCGKTYLMNHILHQKQKPFTIKKSPYEYLNIKAQTSDEIQPLRNYENSIVVFDDM